MCSSSFNSTLGDWRAKKSEGGKGRKISFKSWSLQGTVYFRLMWSHLAKHVSQACKIDPGERENLPVEFSRKQEQSLNGLLG